VSNENSIFLVLAGAVAELAADGALLGIEEAAAAVFPLALEAEGALLGTEEAAAVGLALARACLSACS
jgi:hypothetical protein